MSEIVKTNCAPYFLAVEFLKASSVDKQDTLWFSDGAWHSWTGSHYEVISATHVDQKILNCLAERSLPINRPLIGKIKYFLEVRQYIEGAGSRWLGGESTCPAQLFPVQNGCVDFTSKGYPKLVPHDAGFFNLAAADYDFEPNAGCETWLEFLHDLWPDSSFEKQLLREWFGYCLLSDMSQHKILTITGPRRSGKSTIARVLRELLGPSTVASPKIRTLNSEFGLWGLLDKKLAILPDATLSRSSEQLEEVLKCLSGEDAVDIQRKGLPPLTGICLPTRILIIANEMPAFKDVSGALKGRIMPLSTSRSFYGEENQALTEELIDELPGILNWAIKGWRKLKKRGRFDQPKQSNGRSNGKFSQDFANSLLRMRT